MCGSSKWSIVDSDTKRADTYFPRSLHKWASTRCTAVSCNQEIGGNIREEKYREEELMPVET